MKLNLAQVLFLLSVIWVAPHMSTGFALVGSGLLAIAGFAVLFFGRNHDR